MWLCLGIASSVLSIAARAPFRVSVIGRPRNELTQRSPGWKEVRRVHVIGPGTELMSANGRLRFIFLSTHRLPQKVLGKYSSTSNICMITNDLGALVLSCLPKFTGSGRSSRPNIDIETIFRYHTQYPRTIADTNV